jgi:hypothetical protein
MHCAGGYQHDVRYRWIIDGKQTWRGNHSEKKDGCLYPTHQAGPIAQFLGINHGDRFTQLVSVSSKSVGINAYAAERVGRIQRLAKKKYALGDINTTILKTANGKTVTLYHDCSTYRPYDLMFRVEGTRELDAGHGQRFIYTADRPSRHVGGFRAVPNAIRRRRVEEKRRRSPKHGHGGADYITLTAFIDARAKSYADNAD